MKKKKNIKYDDAEHNDHDYHHCHYYTDYVDNTYYYDKKCDGAEKIEDNDDLYKIVTETISKEASVGVAMLGKVNNHEKLEHFENYSMGKYLPRKHRKNHLIKLPAEIAYRKSLLEAEI